MNKRIRQKHQKQNAINTIVQRGGYSHKAAKTIYQEYKEASTSSVFQNAAKKFGYDAYVKYFKDEGAYIFKENGAYEIIKRYEELRKKGLIGEDALTYNHEDFNSNAFATALVNDLFEDMKHYITTATAQAEEHVEHVQNMLDSVKINESLYFPGW